MKFLEQPKEMRNAFLEDFRELINDDRHELFYHELEDGYNVSYILTPMPGQDANAALLKTANTAASICRIIGGKITALYRYVDGSIKASVEIRQGD